MPFDFIDRVAGKPGRVKITPENGDSPFYAVMERADEATVVGTPLNATNLNAAQETLAYNNDPGAHTIKRTYLATNGNDNNSGDTASLPMATITAAIRKYAKWYKYVDIYLADGEYTENLGTISTDQCSLSIRGSSGDKDAVIIHTATMLESHISLFRLYNLTIDTTASGVRSMSVNAGMLYANNVRFNMPTASTSACINVYNGASAFLTSCVLNAGTSAAALYGNQALHIRAYNCTSERTVGRGAYANNGTVIEYTPTLTATTMAYETNDGKCIDLSARPGAVKGSMQSALGQYMTYDGLLLQWGTVNITPTAADEPTGATVTFPLPYAETPTVLLSPISTVPNILSVGVMRSGDFVSDPKLEVGVMLVRNGVTPTGINWLAIGKGVV